MAEVYGLATFDATIDATYLVLHALGDKDMVEIVDVMMIVSKEIQSLRFCGDKVNQINRRRILVDGGPIHVWH